MENIISTKVKWLRGLAFAFLVLSIVLGYVDFIREGIHNLLSSNTKLNDIAAWSCSFDIKYAINLIISIVALVLLRFLSSTRVTRAAMDMIIAFDLYYLLNSILDILERLGICSSDFLDNEVIQGILMAFYIIVMFLPLYGYSTIVNNNSAEHNIRKWGPVLLLVFVYIIVNRFNPLHKVMDLASIESWPKCYDVYWNIYSWWNIAFNLLYVVAYFKFIYSPVFSGNYDGAAKGSFSPLNKYFIGPVAAGIILYAGQFAVYYFCL